MRLANTTFVNLRNSLNALQPLVDASKPVAPKLQKLLVQLRPLAQDSVPTLKDLSEIISRPGPNNDLIDLAKLGVPLRQATVDNINVDGANRPGAFPQSTTALNDSTPELATDRPYAVDLTGWFEGYSHPGTQDANGGASRIAPIIGIGSLQNGTLNLLPSFADPTLRSVLAFGGLGGVLGSSPVGGVLGSTGLPVGSGGTSSSGSTPGPDRHRPGQSLPGLDGAGRGLLPGVGIPV